MYTYTISTDGKTKRHFSDFSEIEPSLVVLQKGDTNFVSIECSPPIHDVTTISVVGLKFLKGKGFFKKREEVVEYDSELTLDSGLDKKVKYFYMTDCYDEMYQIFEDFVRLQKIPNYSLWRIVGKSKQK